MKEKHLKLIKAKIDNAGDSLQGHKLSLAEFNDIANTVIQFMQKLNVAKYEVERDLAIKMREDLFKD